MITPKSPFTGLPLGVRAHAERISQRDRPAVLRGKPKAETLVIR